ncbi:hypothetical protein ACW6QP_08695 [Salegentibacter sp. HM20]
MKYFLFVSLLFISFWNYSQVGINTTDPKAQLDIPATNPSNPDVIDGILIPRIDRFPATNPSSAQNAMLVYLNKEFNGHKPGYYYWENVKAQWSSIVINAGASNFHKPGTTESPNNIEDPIYRKGNLGLGTDEITGKLQIAIKPGEDLEIKKGIDIDNQNSAVDNFTTYGINLMNRSATNAVKYGIKTHVSGEGSGIHYGIHSITNQNSGTADIYGIYNRVGRTFGANSYNYGIYTEIGTDQGNGFIYGIYSKAEGTNSSKVYAGYFAGRVGIGSNPASDYVLPVARGQKDQILSTDAAGQVSWAHNYTRNYSSTTSATGEFTIPVETHTLRINNQVSSIRFPKASDFPGRMLILINWPGNSAKTLNFESGDNLLEIASNSQITEIGTREVFTIQSAGNRWILLHR